MSRTPTAHGHGDQNRGVLDVARRRLQEIQERYEGDEERPLGGYAAAMGLYTATLGAIALALRSTGRRLPERIATEDLLLLGVATQKIARLLTKDPVTSPLRAPFTHFEGTAGPAELREDVTGHGVRKAVGEVITCPFCAGQWIATALTAGLVIAPRPTRFLAGVFTTVAVSDTLQFATAALRRRAG